MIGCLVSDNQFVFVPRRNITDHVILVIEILDMDKRGKIS